MEIKFIGTSSGKTSLKRFHSSFIIISKDFNLLVDVGDGISKALKTQNIDPNSINGIIISHLHPDHFSGLGSLLVQMKLTGRLKELNIFVHKSVSNYVKDYIKHSYIFEKRLGFDLLFREFKFNGSYNITEDMNFTARQNTHLDKYKSCDPERIINFISCSFLINLAGRNVLYSGDVGDEKDIYLFEDLNIDFLIAETTHISKIEFLSAFRKFLPSKIYLTHISDEDENSLISWKSSLPAEFHNKIELAYDGMSFII